MHLSDRIVGTGLIVLAIVVIVMAARFPDVRGLPFGPDLFPVLIGICIGGAGGLLVFRDLRARPRDPDIDLSAWRGRGRAAFAAAWAVVGMAVAALLFSTVGFPLVALAYAIPLMILMGARPVGAIVTSLLVVGCAYTLLTRVLFVPLPTGLLSFLGFLG